MRCSNDLFSRSAGVSPAASAQVECIASLARLSALVAGRRLGVPVVYEVRTFWEDAAVNNGSFAEGSLRYRVSRALDAGEEGSTGAAQQTACANQISCTSARLCVRLRRGSPVGR